MNKAYLSHSAYHSRERHLCHDAHGTRKARNKVIFIAFAEIFLTRMLIPVFKSWGRASELLCVISAVDINMDLRRLQSYVCVLDYCFFFSQTTGLQ